MGNAFPERVQQGQRALLGKVIFVALVDGPFDTGAKIQRRCFRHRSDVGIETFAKLVGHDGPAVAHLLFRELYDSRIKVGADQLSDLELTAGIDQLSDQGVE